MPFSSLGPGQSLKPDEKIFSPNSRYELIYQTDGNLVVYDHQENGKPIWAAASNVPNPGKAEMQYDGNFCIYNSTGNCLQASGTYGKIGAFMQMQDDGNLVIYVGNPVASNALWASKTSNTFPQH